MNPAAVRILGADDERSQRDILVSSLREEGYRAEGVSGLDEALRALEQGRKSDDPFGESDPLG